MFITYLNVVAHMIFAERKFHNMRTGARLKMRLHIAHMHATVYVYGAVSYHKVVIVSLHIAEIGLINNINLLI